MSSEKKPRTITLEQLVEAIGAVEPELARRDPAAFARARQEHGTMGLLENHPDLLAQYEARLAAISARALTVKVKRGDWVTINGWRLRIGSVNAIDGAVQTERVDVNGRVVSSDWTDGSRLTPDTTPPRPDELASAEPMTARERINQHQAHLVPQAEAPSGSPAALLREGTAELRELEWTNLEPENGASGAHLRRYWAWLLQTRSDRRKQLDDSSRKTEAESPGLDQWRRERVTQIHYFEAILSLLHRIVAPEAAYLCGAECSHLDKGVTSGQLKRFFGSLEAFRACTDYESEENYTAERALGELRHLLAGEHIESAREFDGRLVRLVRITPGAEVDDVFEVRVFENDALLSTSSFSDQKDALALYGEKTEVARVANGESFGPEGG